MIKKNILLSLVFLSCSLDPVVIEPETLGEYYVSCLLSPTFDYQEVLVGKAIQESKPIDINDAVVTVTDQTDNRPVTFSYVKDGIYRDKNNQLKINNGHSYHLEVTTSDGFVLTGDTYVPSDFEILSPASGDTIPYFLEYPMDTLKMAKISWTKAEKARFYSVNILVENDVFGCSPVYTYRNQIFIPELLPKFSWGQTVVDTSIIKASLSVFAHDSSQTFIPRRRNFTDEFLDYTREEWLNAINSSPEKKELYSNVCGGFGRFDALIMTKIDLILKVYINW